jgi:hypothetical protein
MSHMPNDPGRAPNGQDSIVRRAWSQRRQWRAAGIAAVPMIIIILVVWLWGPAFRPGYFSRFSAAAQEAKLDLIRSYQVQGLLVAMSGEGTS